MVAPSAPDRKEWPKVSVVVPARDEAERIEEALRSLARMDYPDFEVIAVDDRSGDGTGAIMDRVAAEEPRVQVLHVASLPEGWLGKCHAMEVGARRAAGDLLLFTDGDVLFAPDTLRLAVSHLEARRLDHLALMPGMIPGGYWEDAFKVYFAMLFLWGLKAWAVDSPSKDLYVGIGAFNLVRRTAHEGIGGHEAIRLEVADDLMLGKRIKQAGYRQEALFATSHLRLRWLEGVRGIVQGLEKNGFAAIGYSLPLLFFITAFVLCLYVLPYLGILFFRDARIPGYAAAVFLMHGTFGYFASFHRNGWLLAPALPGAAFLYLFSIWRSAILTLRRKGVVWRDTFYPLEVLKRGSSG
ncbi:MAG TPA: glycosyltransferase [Candidatus Deferrimicrobiaceae bacterium]|nr:glycosyltransferase [Candidatus Deferrimicrobiaceae bacterium]